MSSVLRRWGGVGAAMGGALLAAWGYLHGNIALPSGPVVAAAMGLLIDALLLAGVAGLCAWWWEGPTGWLGAWGFVLGFAGVALSVAHGIHAFVTASGIAEPAPWWVYVRAAGGLSARVVRWLPVLPKVTCQVYDTNRVDLIAFSQHLHHQIGNTSTGESLFNNTSMSCNMPWLTSAGWFPVEMDEPVRAVNVYYRASGDQTKIKAIPKGLQLPAPDQSYNCNGAPGNAVPFQATPRYGRTENWATSVTSADC